MNLKQNLGRWATERMARWDGPANLTPEEAAKILARLQRKHRIKRQREYDAAMLWWRTCHICVTLPRRGIKRAWRFTRINSWAAFELVMQAMRFLRRWPRR